ncbi:F-box only protein 7 [Conger conger]|uniref:F-box only protein 7 n=1 Tax=Conger conger TaxID=82655 RepID=UPI002A5A1EB6|nr:F-box only protein 7 [Conger conger]
MKLRVRLNKQTSRLELEEEEPVLSDLCARIREHLLPPWGLSPEAEFSLSLNGREPLSDIGRTLSSCGVVSGDLICLILHQPGHVAPAAPAAPGAPAPCSRPVPAREASPESPSSSGCEADIREAEYVQEAGLEDCEGAVPEEEGAGPFSPGPMLCSETENGAAPHALELLHHGAGCQSPCDALLVSAHLLMMETGFVPQDAEGSPGLMPGGWRAMGGLYRLQYSHPLCEDSLAVLRAVPMGNMLVFNASLKVNESVDNARKLLLRPGAYVTEDWRGENAAVVYKDLKKLSRIFKDQLAYPLIASARQAMGLPPAFGLTALPPELLLRVLRLLDLGAVASLSASCRDLRCAAADPSLWRHLYHRDFRDQINRPANTDWKALYRRKYRQRREASRFRRTRLFAPTPPFPTSPYHPFPFNPHPLPYPPGIIGGEYDQRPGLLPGGLPRPRFDPIGSLQERNPSNRGPFGRRPPGPLGNRSSDIRRGFI